MWLDPELRQLLVLLLFCMFEVEAEFVGVEEDVASDNEAAIIWPSTALLFLFDAPFGRRMISVNRFRIHLASM